MNIQCPQCGAKHSEPTNFCKSCGVGFFVQPKRAKVNQNVIAAIFGGIILVVFVFSTISNLTGGRQENLPSLTSETPAPANIKYSVLPYVSLKVTWSKGGFGAVMLGDISIKNGSAKNAKDFVVECDLYGASGTKIGTTSQTIYEIVPAKKSKTFNEVNFGFINSQAHSAICNVTDLTVNR